METLHSDGAYQSDDNRKFTKENDIDFVANGIQGKPSRFDLVQTDDKTLEVTDKSTGEVITAIPVNGDKWKFKVKNKKGKNVWRYFGRDAIAKRGRVHPVRGTQETEQCRGYNLPVLLSHKEQQDQISWRYQA